ncbi:MAG: glycosyl hydrolase, partial [bacterium]
MHMKILRKIFLSQIALLVLFSACNENKEQTGNNGYQTLKEDFTTPPPEARPKGLWCWINGNFEKEGITEEIREAAKKGMGGLDIWDTRPVTDFNNVVPTGPGYPSDEFMEGVKYANQEALKYGINLGFIWNQSVSYRDPANEIKVLQTTEKIITKSGQQTIHLPIPKAEMGKRQHDSLIVKDENGLQEYFWDVAVLAFPVNDDTLKINESQIIDLSGKLQKDHSLTWDVPEGKWKIVRYTGVNSGQEGLTPTPATRKPGLDFLDPDATETHLRYLLDMMKKHLGSLDKSAIQYLCSDSYEFTGNKWTEQFPEFFTETYNYSLKNYLPVLFGYSINSKDSTRRILNDYNQLVSELTIKNHYKKCVEVANEYGIGFVSEAAGPGQPLHNVPFESLKACGVLTYPRGEFWHNRHSREGIDEEHVQIIKGPASAAHIYNQKFVEAESFTSTWLWQEGPADLKPTVDRFFCEGLNLIAFHTFPHTPKKAGLPGYVYGFGTQISENIPWFKMSKPFMEYLGRCSYMLQQGNFVGDFLYFYGDTAPNFVPSKKAEPLFLTGYDYDYINSEVIINSLSVENGKLILPHGQSYEVLVLPDKKSMELKTLQKIEQLVKEGAWIIGQKPEKGYSMANKSQ